MGESNKHETAGTHLDVTVSGTGDKILFGWVERHAANCRVMRLKRVSQLTLADVKDADVTTLAGADKQLVLWRVQQGRRAVLMTVETCRHTISIEQTIKL